MTDPRWLDASDAARYLGMRLEAFSRRVRTGQIPAGSNSLGPRATRWRVDDLDAFMAGESPENLGKSMGDLVNAYITKGLASKGSRRQKANVGRDG